jgi:hypothetical protein
MGSRSFCVPFRGLRSVVSKQTPELRTYPGTSSNRLTVTLELFSSAVLGQLNALSATLLQFNDLIKVNFIFNSIVGDW